ncbi:MAG: glycosyltransferase family 4 protein [Cyanobacteria bacterium]|nr:glycosyltransferase family 4 protein [Cyanobacteriota bacterium]
MRYHVRILAGKVDRSAGSHVYHQELVERLTARGHRVSLVSFEPNPNVGPNVEVYAVPLPAPPSFPFLWRFAALHNYRHSHRGLLDLNLPPADVVIAGEHLFVKAHARRFPQTPWVYLPHSLLVDQEIASYNFPKFLAAVTHRLYVHLQGWALQHATRTMRFTQLACDALTKRYPNIRPRFFINPMATEMPAPTPRASGGQQVRLLWVGQLIPRKRIDLALDVLSRAGSQNWIFDIVGDGGTRAELEAQARRLGIADRVVFHGFQSNPADWYRRADLLVFPSWLENFPVTMVEAMSHGVACLAMRGDGVRYHTANAEIVDHGRDGFLADSDEHFGRLLADLIERPEQLRAAGDAARETVQRNYTWDHHLHRYEQLFEQLVSPALERAPDGTDLVGIAAR